MSSLMFSLLSLLLVLLANEGSSLSQDCVTDPSLTIPEGTCVKDELGNSSPGCIGQCLIGERFDNIRQTLGLQKVLGNRNQTIVIEMNDWVGHQLGVSILRMLIEEMLGYAKVRVIYRNDMDVSFDRTADESCRSINTEVWNALTGKIDQFTQYVEVEGSVQSDFLGAIGREALYVPDYLPFVCAHYKALQEDTKSCDCPAEGSEQGVAVAAMDYFPPDGDANLTQVFGGGPETYACPDNTEIPGWTQSQCYNGKWYPEYCEVGGDCKELYLAAPSWSSGWFESIVRNNQLNFVVAYLGYQGLIDRIHELQAQRRGYAHYWWEPDSLLARFPSVRLVVPDHSQACSDRANPEPMLSGVDCTEEPTNLMKIMSSSLKDEEPDIFNLWDKFTFDNQRQLDIMATEKLGGGNLTIEEAACNWLRETDVDWVSWLSIEDPPVPVAPPSSTDNTVMYVMIGVLAFVVIAAAVSLYFFRKMRDANPVDKKDVPKILKSVFDELKDDTSGNVADYIPVLAKADPNLFAIAVVTTTGKVHTIGDFEKTYSIQSVSKPFMYGTLMDEIGMEGAGKCIGVEPSGNAFNVPSLLPDGRACNPYINTGAIMCSACLPGSSGEKYNKFLAVMSKFAGRQLTLDITTFESEKATAEANFKIGQALVEGGLAGTPEGMAQGLDAYFMTCSTMVHTLDLAYMGGTLANLGIHPINKEQVLRADICQQINSVLMTCGMYNGAGNWMVEVGVPAKSGVSGAIMAVVPGICCFVVFSPRLDANGNSSRGVMACQMLSKQLGVHLMETDNAEEERLSKTVGLVAIAKKVVTPRAQPDSQSIKVKGTEFCTLGDFFDGTAEVPDHLPCSSGVAPEGGRPVSREAWNNNVKHVTQLELEDAIDV